MLRLVLRTAFVLFLAGCTPAQDPTFDAAGVQTGVASWYGKALAGHKTASGEPFDPQALTAAHKTLPLGTWVEVRRLDNGKTVRVRINDRGPHVAGRIIDLSQHAASELDLVRDGVANVEIRVVDGPTR